MVEEKNLDIQVSSDTLITVEDSDEYLRCAQYVKMRELVEKTSKADIAKHFGIDYRTLDGWIGKWSASGLMQRVRQLLFATLIAEEIHTTGDMVSREWASIVDRQIRTAQFAKSDKNALDAAMWLHEAFIKPRMDNLEGDGAEELKYIHQLTGSGSIEPDTIDIDPMAFVDDDD